MQPRLANVSHGPTIVGQLTVQDEQNFRDGIESLMEFLVRFARTWTELGY